MSVRPIETVYDQPAGADVPAPDRPVAARSIAPRLRRYRTVEAHRQALVILVVTSVLVVAWLGGGWLLRPLGRLFGGGRRALVAVWLLLVVASLGLALTLG